MLNLTSDSIIEVNSLTKHFKKVKAVNELSFSVYRGDVFGFLGPNGAGKSTTIRMLLTLVNPCEGEIKLFGKVLKANSRELLKNIGAIVEKPDFYNYLTAYKNLEILGRISGRYVDSNKIFEMLELVGLGDRYNSKVKTFSHGMKQRLGIAQALLHDPELIILDEPSTGLDPQGMKEVRDLINHLSRNRKKTVFISSHILSEVEQVANRMIIINKGEKVVEGEVEKLLKSGDLHVKFEVNDSNKMKSLISNTLWQKHLIEMNGNKFIFLLKEKQVAELNRMLVENGIDVSAVIPRRSLEEYFLNITREAVK